jgi:hypothetical protein
VGDRRYGSGEERPDGRPGIFPTDLFDSAPFDPEFTLLGDNALFQGYAVSSELTEREADALICSIAPISQLGYGARRGRMMRSSSKCWHPVE